MDMEITHVTQNLPIAPRKLRLVADSVRHQDVNSAMAVLALLPHKGARLMGKSLKAAAEMARDHNLDPATLQIQRLMCNTGRTYKRVIGHSRGRMAGIMKQHTHLVLVLSGEELKRTKKATTPKPAEEQEEK